MKKSIVILLTLVYGFIAAQTQTNEFTTALDTYFTALTKQKNFNGNIIVLRNKEVFLNKSYNIEDFKDSLFVKPKSEFLIASVSKIYIKYGILALIQSGKVKLTDKLSKYAPDFPMGDKITVEHLLLNKSGLPRELSENVSYDQYPLNKLVEMAKNEKLLFEPGTQVVYSNIGHFLLQHVIDKTWPKGFDDFMENEVFKKLQLVNTGEFHPTKKPENFVRGFDLINGKPLASKLSVIHPSASGNFYSSVEDLFSFSQQLLSGKNISKSLAKKLFVKDSMLIQTGGREGYRAYYYQSIMTRVTVIFLANYTDIPFQNITEDVSKILDRQPYRLPSNETRVKKAQPDEILKRYAGRYALDVDRNQIFTVTLENNNLYFLDGPEKILITPEDEFTFFDNPDSRDSFIFSLNEKTNKYDFFILVGDVKFATVRLD